MFSFFSYFHDLKVRIIIIIVLVLLDGLLSLVKEYIIDVWEIRKHKL